MKRRKGEEKDGKKVSLLLGNRGLEGGKKCRAVRQVNKKERKERYEFTEGEREEWREEGREKGESTAVK